MATILADGIKRRELMEFLDWIIRNAPTMIKPPYNNINDQFIKASGE
jgi:hypothetical protein